MRRAGHSLIETVMALFLLASVTIFVVMLFDVGLRRSQAGFSETQARLLAESKLAEIRAWAAGGGYRSASDLSSYDGATGRAPEAPEYTVSVQMKVHPLYSPCTTFEGRFDSDQRRVLESSCALTEVTVSWGSGKSISLVSLVPESPRVLRATNPIEIVGAPSGSLSAGSATELQARAFDSEGSEISDGLFEWWVEPITGNASIETDRTGRKAVLHHVAYKADGTAYTSSGTCRVGVRYRYGAQQAVGYSGVLSL